MLCTFISGQYEKISRGFQQIFQMSINPFTNPFRKQNLSFFRIFFQSDIIDYPIVPDIVMVLRPI